MNVPFSLFVKHDRSFTRTSKASASTINCGLPEYSHLFHIINMECSEILIGHYSGRAPTAAEFGRITRDKKMWKIQPRRQLHSTNLATIFIRSILKPFIPYR